jgi:4,5-DOPA dioxygenase extradiol
MFPALFVSHGSPMLAVEDSAARRFLQGLGAAIGRPKAILIVSGHWETPMPALNAVPVNETIHDFYGFPPALYRIDYPAPGDRELANHAAGLLGAAAFPATLAPARGLDHGAWLPLMLMYPEADIPVVQMSLQHHLGPAHHIRVGEALRTLRKEDVLLIGSGTFTHNLGLMDRSQPDSVPTPDVVAFADWIDAALNERRTEDLVNYRRLAPFAVRHHPRDEHFLPLFFAYGAGGEDGRVEHLHSSTSYGTQRMDAYAFH